MTPQSLQIHVAVKVAKMAAVLAECFVQYDVREEEGAWFIDLFPKTQKGAARVIGNRGRNAKSLAAIALTEARFLAAQHGLKPPSVCFINVEAPQNGEDLKSATVSKMHL